MTHTLPHHIASILEAWDNLGFTCKREAAEFVLANKDWKELVKQDLKEADCKVVVEWREKLIAHERLIASQTKGAE